VARGAVVVRGVVRINGAARGAGDGFGLGTKARMAGLLLTGIFSCEIVGLVGEVSLLDEMDAGVDSCAELATTAAGIVQVGGFGDDVFGSL
jgi:hypothetical protein